MSVTIEEIQSIKEQAEQKRRAADRAKGQLEQLMKTLKEQFDCDSLEEAKDKLTEIEQEGIKLSQRIEKLKDRVVSMWNNCGQEQEE